MKAELNDCTWGAEMVKTPSFGSWVLRSAYWLSDEPACSNRVKNTTEAAISTRASPILWRSMVVHLVTMNQAR